MMMMMQLIALMGLLAVHAGPAPPRPYVARKEYPRHVTKILTISNGRTQGGWKRAEFCPNYSYASGFELRVDKGQGRGDETALNGIALKCKSPIRYYGKVESGVGQWGFWTKVNECISLDPFTFYLTSFQLRVERSQGSGDDTAANNIKFKCRTLQSESQYVIEGDGHEWGDYGAWSASCPIGSAICGIQTRVENWQGNGDDTTLNDVKFFCCDQECQGCPGEPGEPGEPGRQGFL